MVRDDLEEERERDIEVEQGTKVSELLDQEGVASEEVLVSRNGTIISGEHELEDGDTVTVRDVIAGG
ncbi:MAG: MoaD/ThiS family protein [Candidatus Nanohaloarchaea archaeon]